MPTPADLAHRPQRPLSARPADTARPAPRTAPQQASTPLLPGVPFRQQWETAIRYSSLQPNARLVALTVATYADWHTGLIPDDQMPGVPRLRKASGLREEEVVRNSLNWLVRLGWIERRDDATYPKRIRLLMPAGARVRPPE
jgi:hypothetical protein